MMRWPYKVLAAAAILAVSAPLYVSEQQAQASPEAFSNEYVDARVCATCHQQIADNYSRTGMGRSFSRGPANKIDAPPDFYHLLSDTHYSMRQRGGELFQRRWQVGYLDKEVNAEELRIDYVLGSGNHSRSYLHRTSRGTLIELPLGWYSEGGGHHAMSPGSDSDHPRTRRFVSYKCMFCHNAVPQIPAANLAPGSDPVYTGDLPQGIDCQRCHGPGKRHIRAVQTRGGNPAEVRTSIVNPARLSPTMRMNICMQCHLETSSERIPAAIVRFDRGPFSFLPGEPLEAFLLSFDHAPGTGHDGKFEAVGSVYRLRQSKCFLRSAGTMTCETCHDAHRAPRGQEAVASYSSACVRCHAKQQGIIAGMETLVRSGKHNFSTECIGCHMPKRRAEDTPGMVMTDHLIQRRPPPRDLLAQSGERRPEEYHGEIVPYYPAPFLPTPVNTLYRAVAQVAMNNNRADGLALLEREVTHQKPALPQFYLVLGDALQNAGKTHEAVAAYEQALRLDPKSVIALRSLAAGKIAAGDVSGAAGILARAAQLAPNDAITWHRSGMLDFRAGRVPQALEKVRKAVALDSTLPEQARNLGEILLQAGQMNQAGDAFEEALRTDPYDGLAWDLNGRLLAQKNELPEALYDFEQAIRLEPGNATPHYDYALILARMARFEAALEHAQAALAIAPNLTGGHELLGGIFERQHRLPEAARAYRRAVELSPGALRIRLRWGMVLAAQSDNPGAAEQFRLAARSTDRSTAQEATHALRRLGQAQ